MPWSSGSQRSRGASRPCSSSSGQAATTIGLLNIAEAGDHVVSSAALYGGTVNLLKYTFKKLGVEVTFVEDQDDLEEWRAAVRPNTKAFFAETIANPKAIVLDIAGVAGVAHEVGVPLVVDNTIATPYLIRPLEWGADVVIHSATKYLGGHGTSIAGVIVDGGSFDFGKDPEKFPNYNTPEESYHGLVFARDLGVGGGLGANLAYILKARVQLLRDLGSAISPFNAFLIAQGVETLSLRVERHIENARQVAAYLEAHPQVESVRWASLDSSPSKALADKYAPKGAGAVLAFEIAGGLEAGQRFVEGLSLHSHVANIGDVRSLAIHPASTTHSQGGDEDRLSAGVTPGLVRLAVGIESIRGHPRRPGRRVRGGWWVGCRRRRRRGVRARAGGCHDGLTPGSVLGTRCTARTDTEPAPGARDWLASSDG